MWSNLFEDRLREWHDLRSRIQYNEDATSLQIVNQWWWRAPMVNYCLHWSDQRSWPGPWELLTNDGYCNISRALGMVYTIALSNPDLRERLVMLHGHQATVVMLRGQDHVMNWDPSSVASIDWQDFALIDELDCSKLLDWNKL